MLYLVINPVSVLRKAVWCSFRRDTGARDGECGFVGALHQTDCSLLEATVLTDRTAVNIHHLYIY